MTYRKQADTGPECSACADEVANSWTIHSGHHDCGRAAALDLERLGAIDIAIRSHPNYRAMLDNLTATQLRGARALSWSMWCASSARFTTTTTSASSYRRSRPRRLEVGRRALRGRSKKGQGRSVLTSVMGVLAVFPILRTR